MVMAMVGERNVRKYSNPFIFIGWQREFASLKDFQQHVVHFALSNVRYPLSHEAVFSPLSGLRSQSRPMQAERYFKR
jgi:hypothetical protein